MGKLSESEKALVVALQEELANTPLVRAVIESKFGRVLMQELGLADQGGIQGAMEIQAAIDDIIREIHDNPKLNRPYTKYEEALELFVSSGVLGVEIQQLKDLYPDAANENTSVRVLLQRLISKLQERGYTIRRRSVYDIVPYSGVEDE